ncbi:hypothetical protein [Breznakiella homolactica]|uniref:Outer membrane protein beta-barrel domain-containing protein n=1 Tax=Breznakiella homolactica TaxID=2798577 RepID=A0A7T7XL44_9SPIR|nr:hypothetical protein [Breznakiella homolactica]QQO08258.1 hypothetical protein JFL75_15145 [Breznakiella homolactica]
MKIKVLVLSAVIAVVSAAGAFAFGLGVQFNGNVSDSDFSPGLSLAISSSRHSHYALNWNFSGSTNMIGLTADYWILNPKIAGPLNFLLGGGLYANFLFSSDDFDFNAGIRVPIGVNLLLARNFFEVYGYVAPSCGVRFYPDFGFDDFFFPVALGVRFWIG